LSDLNTREIGLILPLLFLMLFMGVYPRVFLDRSKLSVQTIRDRVTGSAAGGSYTTSHIDKNSKSETQVANSKTE